MKLFPRIEAENLIFKNRGDGTFEEAGAAWGFNAFGISQGMCLADLDNDGDLDVIMNNLNAPAGIFKNETGAPRLAIRLRGQPPNTEGIGAKITVVGGAVPAQTQEMICGDRYLSGDEPIRVFAAGTLTNSMTIEVAWRSGAKTVVKRAKANRVYEVAEPPASAAPPIAGSEAPARTPLFEDVSEIVNHMHADEPFDDFARQPLLPHALSQLGPGVSWFDLNGDGTEDLLIGGGRSGTLSAYLNNGHGGFTKARGSVWSQVLTRDQTAILGFGPGQVLAGSANYEDGLARGGSVKLYEEAGRAVQDAVPGQFFSAGPLALADVDGDGSLDLFVGGRVIPARYPEPATSLLFKNDHGKFTLLQKFEKIGLVSGAVFSDLDGDARPELILACEWGPVRVLKNKNGAFEDSTSQLGLDRYTGWWAGVATGDFDGDGRLDILASNWGLNSKYHATREHPRKLYYGDLEGRGVIDVIEAYYDPVLHKEVPDRGLKTVRAALPSVSEKWTSFQSYAEASVQEIYGDKLNQLAFLEANTLESMLFLNRGDHFEAVPLPKEAQFSPTFGISVADFDGDGNEDAVLSQNLFAVHPEDARCDAGRGLLLRGDGHGHFTADQNSGIAVYGEQRGCASCDYDGDGRVDLAIAQNGNATKLFHNLSARPGLRVRLRGSSENPLAIGAKLRLISADKKGPVRELHAGSGYWSEDGAVPVMTLSDTAVSVEVQWPGGKTTRSALPSGAREVEINFSGEARMLR